MKRGMCMEIRKNHPKDKQTLLPLHDMKKKGHGIQKTGLILILVLTLLMAASCSKSSGSSENGGGKNNTRSEASTGYNDNKDYGSDKNEGESGKDSGVMPVLKGKFADLYEKSKKLDNMRCTIVQIDKWGESRTEFFFKGDKAKIIKGVFVIYYDNSKKEQYVFQDSSNPKRYELIQGNAFTPMTIYTVIPDIEQALSLLNENGNEKVNGLDCVKGSYVYESVETAIWVSSEYGFVVKITRGVPGTNEYMQTISLENIEIGTVTDADVTLPEGSENRDAFAEQDQKAQEEYLEKRDEALGTTDELWNRISYPENMDNYYAEVFEYGSLLGKVWRLGNMSRIESDFYKGYFDYDKQEAYSLNNGKFVKDADFSMSYFDIDLGRKSQDTMRYCNAQYIKKGETDIDGNACEIFESVDQNDVTFKLYVDKAHGIILKAEKAEANNITVIYEVKSFKAGIVTQSHFTNP